MSEGRKGEGGREGGRAGEREGVSWWVDEFASFRNTSKRLH